MTTVSPARPRPATGRAAQGGGAEAAGRVIAERGADATRFADVAAESGVPVSTLQYYFGSREDLLVAAFRHASGAEIAGLEADLARLDDPWQRLGRIVTTALRGYQSGAAGCRPACGSSPGTSASGTPRCARTRCATTAPGGGWSPTWSGGAPGRPVRAPAEPRADRRAHDRAGRRRRHPARPRTTRRSPRNGAVADVLSALAGHAASAGRSGSRLTRSASLWLLGHGTHGGGENAGKAGNGVGLARAAGGIQFTDRECPQARIAYGRL